MVYLMYYCGTTGLSSGTYLPYPSRGLHRHPAPRWPVSQPLSIGPGLSVDYGAVS